MIGQDLDKTKPRPVWDEVIRGATQVDRAMVHFAGYGSPCAECGFAVLVDWAAVRR